MLLARQGKALQTDLTTIGLGIRVHHRVEEVRPHVGVADVGEVDVRVHCERQTQVSSLPGYSRYVITWDTDVSEQLPECIKELHDVGTSAGSSAFGTQITLRARTNCWLSTTHSPHNSKDVALSSPSAEADRRQACVDDLGGVIIVPMTQLDLAVVEGDAQGTGHIPVQGAATAGSARSCSQSAAVPVDTCDPYRASSKT